MSATLSPAGLVTANTTPAAKLQPKEHGAYAILGIPLITALVISGFTLTGVCIALASVAGFLAHEPLLVAWGHRGSRARLATPAATRRLGVLISITFGCGLIALLLGTRSVAVALSACIVLATSSFLLAMRGSHRTLGGQLWGVVGLSVPCVPILLSGGLPVAATLQIWTAWLIGFAATTVAVRGVIAAQKRHSTARHLGLVLGLIVAVAVLATARHSLAITTLPMLLMSLYLVLQPPPAKYLKRVGWTLVLGTLATSAWMIAAV